MLASSRWECGEKTLQQQASVAILKTFFLFNMMNPFLFLDHEFGRPDSAFKFPTKALL